MTPYMPICPALSTNNLDYNIGGNCKVSVENVLACFTKGILNQNGGIHLQ